MLRALRSGKDTHSRSFVKAVSWRIVAFVGLGLVTYTFTRNWVQTSLITIVYNVVELGIYFVHERVWENITWGKPVAAIPPARELRPDEVEMIKSHLKDLGYIEE